MKTGILVSICFAASLSQAQTAIIAHKSHSGTSSGFFIDPNTNFGIPSPRLVQVIRLNDSTSIEVTDHYNGYFQYDTVYNNPFYANYDLNIDSLQQKSFHRKVEYINFKRSPDSLKQKPAGLDKVKLYHQLPQSPEIRQEESSPKKKKKKSALLFIVLVTGGGLLTFRLMSRIFTPQIAS